MIITEHILGNIHAANVQKPVVEVPYEWFECERHRIRKVADDGTEFGVAVPGGVHDGDILYEDEHCYAVAVRETRLLSVAVHSIREAALAGFELGNRHIGLKIEEGRILVPYDLPTFSYLAELGFDVSEVYGKVDAFRTCRAHGRDHG
ncbi:MAG: hypothetical protein AB7D36_10545 [Oscillospiraceae bacterium]